MNAIKTKGVSIMNYRLETEVKFAKEEEGLDRYIVRYEVQFNNEWHMLDLLVSLKQDMDEAVNELKTKAVEKWNVQETPTLNFNQNG